MATAVIDISQLLESRPEIDGGRVVLRGTGVPVQRIVGLHLERRSAEEIAGAFSNVTVAAVYAALAYYYAHQAELDEEDASELAAATDEAQRLGIEII
jgi:uncharacterized protein (DUF433 family)